MHNDFWLFRFVNLSIFEMVKLVMVNPDSDTDRYNTCLIADRSIRYKYLGSREESEVAGSFVFYIYRLWVILGYLRVNDCPQG